MNNINKLDFPVYIYGELEKYNDVLSKARCRIFYKYENRNGTYISDEFANELLNSLPYAPVKGIYSYSEEDYTDHGHNRDEGRIYGIVPEKPNISWEKHLDEDGVEREYACADVLIFSAIYKEANQIVGKAQSMELYEPSLQYHTAMINGQRYVVFDHGCFLGLQVLGEEVEPCFEGASFYTLSKSIEDIIQKIKQYDFQGGKSKMPKITFKLSDSQKESAIFDLLNPNFTEEGGWLLEYAIGEVYDEYAIAYACGTNEAKRVYYKKNDETNMVEITDMVDIYIVDVTESEKQTLDTLRMLNGGSYELINENLTNAEANAEKCEEYSLKIEELNNSISTLNTEVENAKAEYDLSVENYNLANEKITNLEQEVQALTAYKYSIEKQQKTAVITEYADKLSEELLDSYKEKIDEYSVIDLDKELAYELKKSGASNFTNASAGFLPKEVESGIEAILSRYKK